MKREEVYLGARDYKSLRKKTVGIVGVGALGCSHLLLLSRMGVRSFVIVDRDVVAEENLSTQVLYGKEDVGNPKVVACKEALLRADKELTIRGFFDHLDHANIEGILKGVDTVLDGTDNVYTRFLLDEWCKKNKVPWIFCSVVKEEGMCKVMDEDFAISSFMNEKTDPKPCAEVGVLVSSVAFISSYAVSEAVNVLLKKEYEKRLFCFNFKKGSFTFLTTPKRDVLKGFLSGEKEKKVVSLCGGSEFLIYKSSPSKKGIRVAEEFTDFGDKVIVRAKSLKEAKAKYNRFIGER